MPTHGWRGYKFTVFGLTGVFPSPTSYGPPCHHEADAHRKATSCCHWHGPGQRPGACCSLVWEEPTVLQGVEVRALLWRRTGSGVKGL